MHTMLVQRSFEMCATRFVAHRVIYNVSWLCCAEVSVHWQQLETKVFNWHQIGMCFVCRVMLK